MIRGIALFLTVLTGFSGLVYEVVWQKYLATLLGSHSEATASVLAIFLGGLSVGYWLFGRVTRNVVERAEIAGLPPRLLLVYGALEFAIGLFVVAFPWFFRAIQALSFALPHGASGFGFAIDVALTVLLIGPASVMMGGTIPILTQALSKSLEDATRFHAFIYAFNTAGAFAGAVAAGFFLVPAFGLQNVMLAMGCINLAAGSIFMLLGVRGRAVYSEPAPSEGAATIEHFNVYGTIALLTGFAMMAMQTTIIRVGGLSFGSSEFTFSMVVAVFVLCIALGSFGVSLLTQIPTRLVVINQWGVGILLWLLYTQVEKAPYLIQTLRTTVEDNTGGFYVYYGTGFLLVLLAIGLPVFLSGAALPLLFHHMRRQVDHLGDLAGNLYSWNTVGSLLGALLGGYVLLFWLDLHQVYRIAVAALILAAILLCVLVYHWRTPVAVGIGVVLLVLLSAMPGWDPRLMNAGMFRVRDALPGQYEGFAAFARSNPGLFMAPIIHAEDDPIASVTVRQVPIGDSSRFSLTIATNGKSDGNSFSDYPTMGLAATLPALLSENPENAFVIGWGTGVTVGELASLASIRRVEVAELSPGVMRAAPLFNPATMDAIENPKVEVITSDAYRALMRSEAKYDLIVSEPSNPWVTGVEMLFSEEFLAAARSKLTPGGVYCQWMHQYETDAESLLLVLRTYRKIFDHVAVWGTQYSDLLLLGFNDPGRARDIYGLEERFERADVRASFDRAGVHSFPELLAHELLPLGVVHALDMPGPTHSLYHPRLSHTAGQAFFRGEFAHVPFTGIGEAARLGRHHAALRRYALRTGGRLPDEVRADVILKACVVHSHRCQSMFAEWMAESPESEAYREVRRTIIERLGQHESQVDARKSKRATLPEMELMSQLFDVPRDDPAASPIPYGKMQRMNDIFRDFYHHPTPFDARSLVSLWDRCVEMKTEPRTCRARLRLPTEGKLDDADRARVRACTAELIAGPLCAAGRSEAARIQEANRSAS